MKEPKNPCGSNPSTTTNIITLALQWNGLGLLLVIIS